MDVEKEIMNIHEKLSEVKIAAEKSKAEIISNVSDKIDKGLRETEERISANLNFQIGQAITTSLNTFHREQTELSNKQYAGKWVEDLVVSIKKGFWWTVSIIVIALFSWITGIIHFVVELFYKSK